MTGHSLGGAMAVLFALSIVSLPEHREIARRLRAVYTYGQPLTVGAPFPAAAEELGRRLHRHVLPGDPVPTLPPASWCRLAHLGREWHFENGGWSEKPAPLAQLRSVPRAVVTIAGSTSRSLSSARAHAPDRYVAALALPGSGTETGDRA